MSRALLFELDFGLFELDFGLGFGRRKIVIKNILNLHKNNICLSCLFDIAPLSNAAVESLFAISTSNKEVSDDVFQKGYYGRFSFCFNDYDGPVGIRSR